MGLAGNIKKTIAYARRNGWKEAFYAARERLQENRRFPYTYRAPEEEILVRQRYDDERLRAGESPEAVLRFACHMQYAPVFSILVPACDPEREIFDALLDSVLAQTYSQFELIIADAGLTGTVEEAVARRKDKRIRYHKLPNNAGISGNTNQAAMFASGDYVAFLDHDDVLTPDALYEMAAAVLKYGAEIVYSDEDMCDETGRRFFSPNIKPDFNLDLLYNTNYICHFLVMKRELFLALKLRPRYDGAQDYDLLLRAPKSSIVHVPRVLYHWRTSKTSTAKSPDNKRYAYEAGRAALEEHLTSLGYAVSVEEGRHKGFYRVLYQPDILTVREDVGVVGGSLINGKNRIVGGLMDLRGNVRFAGWHSKDSGPVHIADCVQDADAVDVRCMEIKPALKMLYREVFGAEYEEHIMPASEDWVEKSLQFCRRVKEMGYLIVWDPDKVKILEN